MRIYLHASLTVSGMNRINISVFCDFNDLFDIKVGRDWCGIVFLFQQKGSVGTPSMLRITIFVHVNPNGPGIHFRRCSHDSDGNFGAVRRHDVREERFFFRRRRRRRCGFLFYGFVKQRRRRLRRHLGNRSRKGTCILQIVVAAQRQSGEDCR